MSHIYTDTKPINVARQFIETHSDDALQGAIGQDRLADLEAEARRRKHKRRDSAQ